MATQDQFLRQDVVAQQDLSVRGSTTLGNDSSDVTTVVGKLAIGGTTVQPVASANYGPGPFSNQVIFSFPAASHDAAVCTVTVVDDGNADIYVATLAVAHNGSTATVSSPSVVADLWGGTDPAFNAVIAGGDVQLRLDIADVVSVNVAVDAKLFASQNSEFISVTGQPANDTIVEGDTPASFSVVASTNDGGALSYAWFVDDGVTTTALSDDATYSGALTPTLTITTTDTSLDTYEYYCEVSSTGGAATVVSNSGVLTVNAATVTITSDPVSDTVSTGDPAAFGVVASTNETASTLTYSWEEDAGSGFVALTDTGVYSGTSTAALDISDATGLDGYQYRCVVSTTSAIAPTATSAAATLTVTP